MLTGGEGRSNTIYIRTTLNILEITGEREECYTIVVPNSREVPNFLPIVTILNNDGNLDGDNEKSSELLRIS